MLRVLKDTLGMGDRLLGQVNAQFCQPAPEIDV